MNILKNWTSKSIPQRIEWYKNKIDNLFGYLTTQASFSEDQLGHAALELQHIKCHMKTDLRTIPVINASRMDINYIDAVGQAFLKLNHFQSDLGNWIEVLGKTNEIILMLKHRQ